MRIVQALHAIDLRAGGPARVVVDLSAVLASRGHEIVIATENPRDVSPAWMTSPTQGLPTCVTLPSLGWQIWNASFRRAVENVLTNADLVHLHGLWEPFNLRVASIARRMGIPYIVTLHGMLDDWCMAQRTAKKQIYLAVAGRKMLENAAAVHCTAAAELAQSQKWFSKLQGTVIPNLVDLSAYENLPGADEARARFAFLSTPNPKLIFLSRISPKKGCEHLLECVEILRGRGILADVVIAGTGPAEYVETLKASADRRGIADAIHFVGHIDGTLKISLLQAGDLLVIPTSQENFGLVFFEALAAGLPVVTTNLVDTKDELAQSGAGWIVPQNATAFADTIEMILKNPSDVAERKQRGRRWIFDNLATSAIACQIESMYEFTKRSKRSLAQIAPK